jgi:hypothetical protein
MDCWLRGCMILFVFKRKIYIIFLKKHKVGCNLNSANLNWSGFVILGYAHVARPSRFQKPTIQERPKLTSFDMSIKHSLFPKQQKDKLCLRLNPLNTSVTCMLWRFELRWASEDKERIYIYHSYSHDIPSSGTTTLYICCSTILATFYVGLNLALHSSLYTSKNLGSISRELAHMGFEFYKNNWITIWATSVRPNISTIAHPISNPHLEIF